MTRTELEQLFPTIVLERRSSMPNATTQSYAYAIKSEIPEAAKESLSIYEAGDGTKLLYSRVRVGKLGADTKVAVRIVAERKGNVETGRHFINIVNGDVEAKADQYAAAADDMNIGARFFGPEYKTEFVKAMAAKTASSINFGKGRTATPAAAPAVEQVLEADPDPQQNRK